MDTDQLLEALAELGRAFERIGSGDLAGHTGRKDTGLVHKLASLAAESHLYNPWFIPEFVQHSFKAWGEALKAEALDRWLQHYPGLHRPPMSPKTVAVVMAGNLPMVGLHDLICVLAGGHKALVKLSGQDDRLIPAVVEMLLEIAPAWQGYVEFSGGPLKGFDAVIATGSNNTSRYFDYYFGRYPHIIRKNRNGVAVISGNEPDEWYRRLADDIFLYFGLGCRNVSKVYLPAGFEPASLFKHFHEFARVGSHHKYANNYDYQKSILMVNRMEYLDNGFLLLRPDPAVPSPVAVLHYEHYHEPDELARQLTFIQDQIQCVVTGDPRFEMAVAAGRSQLPALRDYADGVDTMDFLLAL